MKAHRVSRGIAPLIPNLVNLTLRQLHPGNITPVPTEEEARQSELFPQPGFEPRTAQPVALSLSRLPFCLTAPCSATSLPSAMANSPALHCSKHLARTHAQQHLRPCKRGRKTSGKNVLLLLSLRCFNLPGTTHTGA